MMQRWTGVVLTFWAMGTAGCSLETTCEGDECTATSSVAEPLVGGWASGPYTWSQGEQARKMPSIASNVCVLTRVSGKFAGTGEAVQVTDDGSNWYLQGFSQQSGVGGEAYCFPRDGFVGGGTRVSSEVSLTAGARYTCGSVAQTDMYAADAVAFLSGVQGSLHFFGDWVHTEQALSPDVASFMQAHVCTTSTEPFPDPNMRWLTAYGRSFRVGAHSSRLAIFANRNGNRGDANTYPEYVVGGPTGSAVAVLAPTSDAMCVLTTIQGDFDEGGEFVQIRAEVIRDVEHWVLRSTGHSRVYAGARCFARDQT